MTNGRITAGGRRRGDGFTLIELLAVISIMLILLSLIVPALGSARKRAGLPPCANNLRQVYQLCLGYGEVYNNELPQGLSENPQMFNIKFQKFTQLNNYMKDFGLMPLIWYCPSVPKQYADVLHWADVDVPGTPEEFPIGYFYTGNVTTGSLWKFKVKPPFTRNDFFSTGTPFVWDICKAHRPSPIPAPEVTDWWIFPHYGIDEPAVAQFMMAGGHITRRKLSEMEQRFNYIHPGEIYW